MSDTKELTPPEPEAQELLDVPRPPPLPAMRERASDVRDVRDARQAPAPPGQPVPGHVLAGRFRVERMLGASGGATSHLCEDLETGELAVVKVLTLGNPSEEAFGQMAQQVRLASAIRHRNLMRALGMGRTEQGGVFVAMQYSEGRTLSSLVHERRAQGRRLSLRDAFTILAHTCNALHAAHPRVPHGVLTPFNIAIDERGGLQVTNLAIGRISALYMHGRGEGPFVDSIFVAPEVAANPQGITPAADIYSVGMLAAELLHPTGLVTDREHSREAALQGLESYPPRLVDLIALTLDPNPARRPNSALVVRDTLEAVLREANVRLTGPGDPHGLVLEPAVVDSAHTDIADDDLFNLPGIESRATRGSGSDEERYLVQKAGLDYGPYSHNQVLEQLQQDTIHEHTLVLDRITQVRRELQEMPEFAETVRAHIPVREQRRQREAQARAELQRKVKQGGLAVFVAGIIGGLVILAGFALYWFNLPDPEPLPLERAFASMDYRFLPPPTEFQTVAVDPSVLQNIFNPKASEEEVASQIRKMRAQQAGAAAGPKAAVAAARRTDGAGGADVVDMSQGGSSLHLSDEMIHDVITGDLARIRSCLMREFNRNRQFRGVGVQFFIRPSGTTGGVKLKESAQEGSEVGECVVQRFRVMKFPENGAIQNRSVFYPLYFQ